MQALAGIRVRSSRRLVYMKYKTGALRAGIGSYGKYLRYKKDTIQTYEKKPYMIFFKKGIHALLHVETRQLYCCIFSIALYNQLYFLIVRREKKDAR